ncbi:MAG: hypothetical protein ACRENJ_04050 [Candidatus Eiseniibacteriota bacterium]
MLVASGALLVTLLGCRAQVREYRPTPGPGLSEKPAPPELAALVAYGSRLEFDTLPGAGDAQRLHVGGCPPPPESCPHGPLAKIEPERGSYAIPRDSLWRGWVIARIVNEERGTYPKFGQRGQRITYWWVDSLAGRDWRSVFVSEDTTAAPFVSDLDPPDDHPRGTWKQALARWIWDPRDEAAWGTCGDSWCCRSSGGIAPS